MDGTPSSHASIGESKIMSSTDVVCVRHGGAKATFEVRPKDDGAFSTMGNEVHLNPEAAKLFPQFSPGDTLEVETDASRMKVMTAQEVEINPHGAAPDQLEKVLRENKALLHPITESYDFGPETIEFSVTDVSPSHRTVRVSEKTEFTFDKTAHSASVESGSPAGPPSGAGSSGGVSGDQSAEEAAITLEAEEPRTSFQEDVAGLQEVKRTAQMMLELYEPDTRDQVEDLYGEEFAGTGGGMMLYGPPGCGKTLISEAIAYEAKHNTQIEEQHDCDVRFLKVKGSDVMSKYSGESEKNVEAAFDQAHQEVEDGGFAVLFFDEVETLIPDRSDDNLQRHERALTNAFLQQMNDVEERLLVIGATNMPFSIDPAATRRFPIQQFIPQPDAEVMAEVWSKSLGKIAEQDDVDCAELGEASAGFTPAEIADRVLGSELQRELVESVALEDRDPITPDTQYLLSRLEETEPKTIRQYVSSVMKQAQELEGFPEMKSYVKQQAEKFGPNPAAGSDTSEQT